MITKALLSDFQIIRLFYLYASGKPVQQECFASLTMRSLDAAGDGAKKKAAET